MPNNGEWYFCRECNKHTKNKEEINECLLFRHSIKKRVPLSERIVYGDIGFNIPHILKLDVDGDKWTTQVTLLMFTTRKNIQGKIKTKYLTKITLSPDLNNMVKHLNHLFPFLQYTPKKLLSLLKNAIKKGVFKELGRSSAVIYITLNDWMRLKPKNEKSKLIYTSQNKLQRLFKSDSKILRGA